MARMESWMDAMEKEAKETRGKVMVRLMFYIYLSFTYFPTYRI